MWRKGGKGLLVSLQHVSLPSENHFGKKRATLKMTDSVKNKPPGISSCQGNMSEGEGLGENTLVVLLLRFL